MKLRDFREEKCGKEIEFEKMGLKTPKGIGYYKSVASKKLVKEILLRKKNDKAALSVEEIESELDSEIPDRLFFPLAKARTIRDLTREIERFQSYINLLNTEVLEVDVTRDLLIEGEIITVKIDFIFNHKGFIEVCILRNPEPILSHRARNIENKVNNSPELYLLARAGKALYKDDKIVASSYSLTSKGDKKNKFDEVYELKEGRNIVSCPMDKLDEDYILDRIKNIIKEGNVSIKPNCFMCRMKSICNYEGEERSNLIPIESSPKASGKVTLTSDQMKAVSISNGFHRINAGAGSGKTTVIALRVVELLSQGVRPEDILLITFTNKGGVEMREKIGYWLQEEGIDISVDMLNIETFNSWGDTLIKKNYSKLGFNIEPKLLEKVDKYDIIFDVLKTQPEIEGINYKNPLLNLRHAKGSVVQMSNMIDKIKSNRLSRDNERGRDIQLIFDIYDSYNKRLKELSFIEYQDQVNLSLELVDMEDLDISYEHVIVDEFQDVDFAQVDLIEKLSKKDKFNSLMIVGDDSQAIFSFRNSTPDNIINFHKDFPNVKDVFMVDNFRSTPEIVRLANEVNRLNKSRVEKELVSNIAPGNKPTFTISKTQEEEVDNIINNIKTSLICNNPSDIAIIARTKNELFAIKDRLIKENIPFIFDIPEPIITNASIQMSSSLISYLNSLDGNQGIFEFLYLRNHNKETVETLDIQEEIKLLDEDIKRRVEDSEDKNVEKLNIFYELMDEFDSGVTKEFMNELKEKECDFYKVHEYITKLVAYEDPRTLGVEDEQKYDAITLTTAHTSKGKEFNTVFALMARYNPSNEKEMEEDIRVFFVAITRARKELFISTNEETNASHEFFNKIAGLSNNILDKKRTF